MFGQVITTSNDDGTPEVKQRMKSPSQHQTASGPTSSDILFLKRLLYLKAAIDNESTLNTFSVPFEQDKYREIHIDQN